MAIDVKILNAVSIEKTDEPVRWVVTALLSDNQGHMKEYTASFQYCMSCPLKSTISPYMSKTELIKCCPVDEWEADFNASF